MLITYPNFSKDNLRDILESEYSDQIKNNYFFAICMKYLLQNENWPYISLESVVKVISELCNFEEERLSGDCVIPGQGEIEARIMK